MSDFLNIFSQFIISPLFRWILIFLSIIVTILQYLNEPQRFSYYKSPLLGIPFKWYIYGIGVVIAVTTTITLLNLWATIPFTNKLPDYWYVYVLILYLAIITQITSDSKEYTNDGSFNPPPSYVLPQKYRVVIAYIGLIIDIFVMLQIFIYFGVADPSKKTYLNYYIVERFGGFYTGNKIHFLFQWAGVIHVIIKIYLVYLQKNFHACDYGLPDSWNA